MAYLGEMVKELTQERSRMAGQVRQLDEASAVLGISCFVASALCVLTYRDKQTLNGKFMNEHQRGMVLLLVIFSVIAASVAALAVFGVLRNGSHPATSSTALSSTSPIIPSMSAGTSTVVPSTSPRPDDCATPYSTETNITDPNHPLAVESRQVILNAGISRKYFDNHFRFLCAVADNATHREVRWQYSIDSYTTMVDDQIGSSDTRNLHGISTALRGLHEIVSVISSDKAGQAMRTCLGQFKESSVMLGWGPLNHAGLYLVARSTREVRDTTGNVSWDVGYVDLETSTCSKTQGGTIHAPRN